MRVIKFLKDISFDVIGMCGAGLVAFGLSEYSKPLGYIFIGAICLIVAVLAEKNKC